VRIYRERVLPSVANLLLPLLLFVSVIAIMLPINAELSLPLAFGFSLGLLAAMYFASPILEITENELICKGARIDRKFLGSVQNIPRKEIFEQLGQKLDARAWLAIQPSVKGLLKIEILDQNDPTPYWMVSSRNVERVKNLLEKI